MDEMTEKERAAWLEWRPVRGAGQPSRLEREAMARGLPHEQHIDECMARLTEAAAKRKER